MCLDVMAHYVRVLYGGSVEESFTSHSRIFENMSRNPESRIQNPESSRISSIRMSECPPRISISRNSIRKLVTVTVRSVGHRCSVCGPFDSTPSSAEAELLFIIPISRIPARFEQQFRHTKMLKRTWLNFYFNNQFGLRRSI